MLKLSKYALIIAFFIVSCRNSIIPEKDMVSIIVKTQLIDAAIKHRNFQNSIYNKDTIDFYSKTIQSFGYTKAQFDSSLKTYTRNSKKLDAIYDKVIIELSEIETKINAKNIIYDDSIVNATNKNLWNKKTSYELTKNGPKETIDFAIPVQGLGNYTISADVLIHDDDESVKPSMVAYFFFDDKSKEGMRSGLTTSTFTKTEKSQTYTIEMMLHNSLVTHLKGSLFSYDSTESKFKSHASISKIKVYYKLSKSNKTRPANEEFLQK